MKVLRDCAVVSAEVSPVYAQGSNKPVSFQLKAQVGFLDRAAREQLGESFDGFERLTLHVPTSTGFTAVPMSYVGQISTNRVTLDRHEATVTDVDLTRCLKEGVAIALETNTGPAALQNFGVNYAVAYRSR